MTKILIAYYIVWSLSAIVFVQIDRSQMIENFFIGMTLFMALLAGGAVTLLVAERRARNRIIDSSVLEIVKERTALFDHLKQQYLDAMLELERLRRKYEARTAEMAGAAIVRRNMLVVQGEQEYLQWDMAQLENMGFRVETLHAPTLGDFEAHLNSLRNSDNMPYYVHLAKHGSPKGVRFADGFADPLWLNRQLRGVRYVSLAVCDSSSTAYKMRLVSGHTFCFAGAVDSDGASRMVKRYYQNIITGRAANEAFWDAKAAAPAKVADLALMVSG